MRFQAAAMSQQHLLAGLLQPNQCFDVPEMNGVKTHREHKHVILSIEISLQKDQRSVDISKLRLKKPNRCFLLCSPEITFKKRNPLLHCREMFTAKHRYIAQQESTSTVAVSASGRCAKLRLLLLSWTGEGGAGMESSPGLRAVLLRAERGNSAPLGPQAEMEGRFADVGIAAALSPWGRSGKQL